MLRQWRSSASPLAPRLQRLRLHACLFGSTHSGNDGDGDVEALPLKKKTTLRDLPAPAAFEFLPAACKAYHAAAGHFNVPYSLVIPLAGEVVVDGRVVAAGAMVGKKTTGQPNGIVYGSVKDVSEIDWPERTRGMRFGRAIHALLTNAAHRVKYWRVIEELREMGVNVDEDWRDDQWRDQEFASLQAYYELHGNSIVPQDFVVPRDDPQWPVEAWGLPLGSRSHELRDDKDQLPQWKVDALATINFSYDAFETTWVTEILPSLRVFADVYGNCDVRRTFVVPAEAPWPTAAWGLRLGATVNCIRNMGTFSQQVDRDSALLEAIGLVVDDSHSEHKWNHRILPSLQVFARVYGHGSVPRTFMVPASDPWPKAAWGMNLGSVVFTIRAYECYKVQTTRDAAELQAIGFVFDLPRQDKWDNKILPALRVFYQLHHHSNVPHDFVVPSEAPWPERAFKLKLGHVCSSMKFKGTYHAQRLRDRAALEAIRFDENVGDEAP